MKTPTLLKFLLSAFVFLLLCVACSSTKLLTKKELKSLKQQMATSPVFAKSFTGFHVYDPATKKVIYEQFSDKYFTPASTTKIFTFYVADKILGDTIPALKYVTRGDSLIFWGTGDPSLFHPHLPSNQAVSSFLNNRTEQLFYCGDNFMDTRYGAGWMWDDYPYYFQVELAALPIYGNFIRVQGAPQTTDFSITPGYFTNKIRGNPTLQGTTARFYRQAKSNFIDYNQQPVGKTSLDRALPFLYADSLAIQLLQDSVNRPIQLVSGLGITPADHQTIYSVPTDSVLHRMMHVSDNFLADHLMLLCANTVFDTLNLRKGIDFAKDSLFKMTPDELLWVDGSGLSRYNQFTPRSMVKVLEKIYLEIPAERWQVFFPILGQELQNDPTTAFIYAKTGSMSNVRCLGGFLLTKSGKTLIFSFMNNHIPTSSRPWIKEMNKILTWLHEQG